MKNRFWSLMIVLGIYIVAAAGAVTFAWFMQPYFSSALLLVFVADIIATLIVFISSLFFRNASVYDPYWSVAPPLIVIGFYLASGTDFSPLHLIILIPLMVWAIRLTYNWCKEFESIKWQDWRYVKYKEQFPKLYIFINLTGIMLMPTLLVFAGMIPVYYLIVGTANLIALIVGATIMLSATTIQAVADYQMRKFRQNPANKGKCIDSGVWRHSRHPNYFGEITMWTGVFVCSIPNITWFSPIGFVAIMCLFIFVSVPLMEKKMLKSRPEYKTYQEAVPSILVPFFRRKGR